MKVISVIPARGGSKRLPGKNIKNLGNKPLIAYSIESSLNSKTIDRTFVTTDCSDIKRHAVSFGAEVIQRPANLACDTATTLSAVRHVLETLEKNEGYQPDAVVILQPTCPFRSLNLIDSAFDKFLSQKGDSLISVSETRFKLGTLKNGFFMPEYQEGLRKQDMKPKYKENGVLYITKCSVIMQEESLFGKKIVPFMIDNSWAQVNIDTVSDFVSAEFFLNDYLADLSVKEFGGKV